MVVGDNKSTATKNAGELMANSIAMAMQWYNTGRRPIEPSGECLRHIAPGAAMVDEFVESTQNTNKKLFLAN
jgi:hypothetical protein